MSNRVILITGGNGGIGLATARAFLDEESTSSVWLGVHQRRDRAEALVHEYPGRCRCISLDVTDPGAWRDNVAALLSTEGRLDVLVNSAGAHEDMLLAMMPTETWNRVIAANLNAVFHGCQAVIPAMISQRTGRIINVSSLSALLPPAGQCNYAAAKAGVVALTQSLAKELARLGITVNAVCPGFVETEALAGMTEAQLQGARAQIPMRRFGRPAEIAAAIRFLACDQASYITGSVLKIDGGVY
jgi:3-oxoacyl-[acyl-carrier protein] reductase